MVKRAPSTSRSPGSTSAIETKVDLEASTPLLGGRSPRRFMAGWWHKRPLLVRQAMPGVQAPVTRAELFALAGREDVESRLVVQEPAFAPGEATGSARRGRRAGPAWRLAHGPLGKDALPPVAQPRWTVLVQGVDLQVPAALALRELFRFIPETRLDDVMISWASDGGGVGPHFDAYDVFLLQVQGRRRWRIGRLTEPRLLPDVPLKLLANFDAEFDWVLGPGDLLYLPPGWAHDGVAEGECMTCSIGFRAAPAAEIVRETLLRLADEQVDDGGSEGRALCYADPRQPATREPARIPARMQAWSLAQVRRALRDTEALCLALGEQWSEPKPHVWFAAGPDAPVRAGVRLAPASRMLYDDAFVYLNGQSWRVAGQDAVLLRRLANRGVLDAAAVRAASPVVRAWLREQRSLGWLVDAGKEQA